MVTLPSSFSGGIQSAVESIKKGTLPQSVTSPVVKPEKVKQTTKLPVKKTGYVPLTREQFMKAQESGFTPDQIIEMEKRRKAEMEGVNKAPEKKGYNPIETFKENTSKIRDVFAGGLSGITKGVGNIAQFVEKTPTIGEAIFGRKQTNLPSIADPIQKSTNMVADTATQGLGANPESNYFKGGQFAGQITLTSTLLPGVGGATGLGTKVAAGATEGALQGAAFDIINQGKATKENVGIGAAFGGALPVVGATLSKGKEYFTSKLPAKLQLQGLMNPAKVTMLKKQLQTDGVATPEDVAKWMIDRNIKGDKETIIKTLISRAEQSKQAVDDSLAAVSGTVQSNIAKNALQQSYDDVSKIAGLEDEASRILELLNKDTYTLSELNQVKRILDDQYNLFTKTGDPTAGLKAKGLQGIRQQLRQTIEDVASKAGIKNIKALNNETQIARGMADAIARKDSADAVREALTAFAPTGVGGIIGGVAGPFDNNTVEGKVGNILLGMFVGRVAGSTKLKTNVASFLSKLSKKEVSALDAYLKAGGKSALPLQILEKLDDTIKLLPPASGLPTSAKVVDVQPMTGFLPGVLQKQSEAISSKVGKQPLTTGLPKNLSKSAINSEASTVLPKKTTKVNIPGKKVSLPIIQKTEVKAKLPMKETPKTPQVEGKTAMGKLDLKNEYDEGFHILNEKGESVMNLGKVNFDEAKDILRQIEEGTMKIPEVKKDLSIPDGMKGIAKKVDKYDNIVYRTDNAKDMFKGKTVFGKGKYFSLGKSDALKISKSPKNVYEYKLPSDLNLLEVRVSNNFYQNGQKSETWRNSFQKMIEDKGFDGAIIKVSDDPKFNLAGDQIVIYNREKLSPTPSLPLSQKSEVKYGDMSGQDALYLYTDQKYKEINSLLRKGDKNSMVDLIDKEIGKNKFSKDITLYRGVDKNNLGKLLKDGGGKTYTDDAFISTSASPKIAQDFSDGYILEIKNTKGLNYAENPSSGKEMEYILPRGMKFDVIGKRKEGEFTVIQLSPTKTKSSLPMSANSEVKYSEAVKPNVNIPSVNKALSGFKKSKPGMSSNRVKGYSDLDTEGIQLSMEKTYRTGKGEKTGRIKVTYSGGEGGEIAEVAQKLKDKGFDIEYDPKGYSVIYINN